MFGFFYGLTVFAMIKAGFGFTSPPEDKSMGKEGYNRLLTIHAKNKYGFHTRWMSDFDLFLESMLNEKFIEDSTNYYDDQFTTLEIQDMEVGLNGDFAHSDVRHALKDKGGHHGDGFKATRNPDRCATNYPKGDDISCYKVLPKGAKPHV